MADFAIQAQAQDFNLVGKFEKDLHNLLAVLGKSNVQVLAPGTAWKIYKKSGSLSTAVVGEKELIPDSGIEMGAPTLVELTYKKYRNLTSIEKVGQVGYEIAVGGSNEVVLREVQKAVREDIYAGIKKGTGTASDSGFQATLAAVAAQLEIKFEDEAFTPVFFANPVDVYKYVGTAAISVQNAFGLRYIENFLGIGTIIMDSNVDAGTVIGTATENLNVLAASITSIPGISMATDESGVIAVHNGTRYENAALETVVYSGLAVQPTYLDRIYIGTIA